MSHPVTPRPAPPRRRQPRPALLALALLQAPGCTWLDRDCPDDTAAAIDPATSTPTTGTTASEPTATTYPSNPTAVVWVVNDSRYDILYIYFCNDELCWDALEGYPLPAGADMTIYMEPGVWDIIVVNEDMDCQDYWSITTSPGSYQSFVLDDEWWYWTFDEETMQCD